MRDRHAGNPDQHGWEPSEKRRDDTGQPREARAVGCEEEAREPVQMCCLLSGPPKDQRAIEQPTLVAQIAEPDRRLVLGLRRKGATAKPESEGDGAQKRAQE